MGDAHLFRVALNVRSRVVRTLCLLERSWRLGAPLATHSSRLIADRRPLTAQSAVTVTATFTARRPAWARRGGPQHRGHVRQHRRDGVAPADAVGGEGSGEPARAREKIPMRDAASPWTIATRSGWIAAVRGKNVSGDSAVKFSGSRPSPTRFTRAHLPRLGLAPDDVRPDDSIGTRGARPIPRGRPVL